MNEISSTVLSLSKEAYYSKKRIQMENKPTVFCVFLMLVKYRYAKSENDYQKLLLISGEKVDAEVGKKTYKHARPLFFSHLCHEIDF